MGRDAVALVLGFDWTAVTVAMIAAVGSIIAACANIIVIALLWTPSRTRIGKQVEDVQHIALGTHYRMQQLLGQLGVESESDE